MPQRLRCRARLSTQRTPQRIARARRFRGNHRSQKINASYVGRLLRLTLLALDIVEAILEGEQPAAMTLAVLMRPFAVGWDKQQWRLDFVRVPF